MAALPLTHIEVGGREKLTSAQIHLLLRDQSKSNFISPTAHLIRDIPLREPEFPHRDLPTALVTTTRRNPTNFLLNTTKQQHNNSLDDTNVGEVAILNNSLNL